MSDLEEELAPEVDPIPDGAKGAMVELTDYLERANGENWQAREPEIVYDRFSHPPEVRVGLRCSHLDHDAALFFTFVAEKTGGIMQTRAGLEEGENFLYVTFTYPE